MMFLDKVFAGRTSRITAINIRYCYPDSPEQQQLINRSLLETAKVAVEMAKVLFQSHEKSYGRIEKVTGKDLLDSLVEQGHGIIILAPHLGNWEYLGHFLAEHYDLMNMFKPAEHPVVNEIVIAGRANGSGKLAPTNKKGVMMVLRHLKSGGISGILPDQVPEEASGWVAAPFMGHRTPTMTLASNLASKPNIKAVAAFAKRLRSGNFEVIIKPVDKRFYDKNAEASATALNQAIESLIEEAPEQYQWEYKRFKLDENGNKNPIYRK